MDRDEHSPAEALRRAADAARRGDARTYVLELAASHALDGVTRRLASQWPDTEDSTIESDVADAADDLYTKLAGGASIVSEAGYLWGSANNRLLKRHRAGLAARESLDEERHGAYLEAQPESESDDGVDDRGRLAEAIRLARGLIPSLGQTVVVNVMTAIIDAVERGEQYVDNTVIAEITGLTPETVRKARHRGFLRLTNAARKQGYHLPDRLTAASHDEREDD